MPLRLSVLSLVFCVTLSACASIDYVPETGWGDKDWSADFYEEWFGNQLAAAREPSLLEPTALGSAKSRFRLLVLPSFSPATVYRIDEASSGNLHLIYKVLDGAGGYDPGQIALTSERELTATEALAFTEALNAAQLPSAQRDAGLDATVDEDGNEILTVCADGTQIVLERLTASQSIFITRHECELERYPELGNLYATVSELSSPN